MKYVSCDKNNFLNSEMKAFSSNKIHSIVLSLDQVYDCLKSVY